MADTLCGLPIDTAEFMPKEELWLIGEDGRLAGKVHSIGKGLFTEQDIHDIQVKHIGPAFEEWCNEVSPIRRALGYTCNPNTCTHNHKRFIRSWFCRDCGTGLGEDGNGMENS